jgi:hypothetical protein
MPSIMYLYSPTIEKELVTAIREWSQLQLALLFTVHLYAEQVIDASNKNYFHMLYIIKSDKG